MINLIPKPTLQVAIAFLLLMPFQSSWSSNFPKVDQDLQVYHQTVKQMKAEFSAIPADPLDQAWVQKKLDVMFNVDQYMRHFWKIPYEHQYTEDEKKFFAEQFNEIALNVDQENTTDLKELLKIYGWFKVSEFGETADNQAWLLVQHADQDPLFQKEVLSVLEKLYPSKETKPGNYAYLFDRVAASWGSPSERKLQRYGTQGGCTGPGTWEPIPMEDPVNVDKRRAEVGLSTMAEYLELFKGICH